MATYPSATAAAITVIGLTCAACGGSSAPTAPAPLPPTQPPVSTVTVTGQVTATNGGQPISGATAAMGGATATTDGAGAFSVPLQPAAAMALALSGAAIVSRTVRVAAMNTRSVAVDAIALDGTFSLDFYRQLVRDGLESPGRLQPLRRWTINPSVYLRVVDDTGAAIDARTLDATERAIRESVPAWTNNTLNLSAFERGADTRAGQAGWVTVSWYAAADGGKCGNADIAQSGGAISLFPRVPNCRCAGGPEIRPRLVRHEMGHAMGFFHTESNDDLMNATIWTCDAQPTARERYHASIAYHRPVGNVDPDNDAAGPITLQPLRVP